MHIATLTIVGVGLLGGSIGLAAKERKLATRIVGVGRSRERLEPARQRGIIDEIGLDLAAAAAQSDLMVFCTPVDEIAGQIQTAAGSCPASCLLTDVGSTKRQIVEDIERRCENLACFVGSHPLAGSEKQGWQFADAKLFLGRTVVVTPTAKTPPTAVEYIKQFWRALGATVFEMDPAEHDRVLARTSHLPHLAASALAASLQLQPDQLRLAANGLRDTTRIAAGDPDLWAAILLENRQEILQALSSFRHTLDAWQPALENADRGAIKSLLEQGKKFRDALGN
jgi:prephenate dehydrogenase